MLGAVQLIPIDIVKAHPDAKTPKYKSEDAAGADMFTIDGARVEPGQKCILRTGIKMAIPRGWEGQIRPRSGNAFNHTISIVNSPGTIDADYRGEVDICLINHDLTETFEVEPGDRIAQIVFNEVGIGVFNDTDKLPETKRGEDGYGSTGNK